MAFDDGMNTVSSALTCIFFRIWLWMSCKGISTGANIMASLAFFQVFASEEHILHRCFGFCGVSPYSSIFRASISCK